jgi:uncharacterized protein YbjT (DUF2867 family)
MKVILFGATGMIGQGVLRECLLDPDVEHVLSIGRRPMAAQPREPHDKLEEIVHDDLFDLSPLAARLAGYDACFFCLGVSSAGMSEAEYRRVTYDLTLAVAIVLVKASPAMTFIYVSGAGTNESEKGGSMWSRVKGETENAIRRLPFRASAMFRPAMVQPLDGIKSRTTLYRVVYAITGPTLPMWKALFPKWVTTTRQVGRAMIEVVKHGAPTAIVENALIAKLAEGKAIEGAA